MSDGSIHITEMQKDALTEIIHIGIGRAASLLNEMISKKIILTAPEINFVTHQELSEIISKNQEIRSVLMEFDGDLAGKAAIIFPVKSAINLITAALGDMHEGPVDVNDDELMSSTLTEIGNIVLSSVIGSVTNALKKRLIFSVPRTVNNCQKVFEDYGINPDSRHLAIIFVAQFSIEDLEVKGEVVILFKIAAFEKLLEELDKLTDEI